MKAAIAYIDDNKLNLDCIRTVLDPAFSVDVFSQPETFLAKFDNSSYDTILLDIHMPTIDGFTLYEKILEHPHYNGCPILFLSSDDSDSARVQSFILGAVDFIHRTIKPDEMIARIKSKIAFFQKHRSIIEISKVKVNLTLLKAYFDNKELPLTFIEFKILCLLMRNLNNTITKDQLIQQVWRTDHVLDATIHTHISNLNGKLEQWDHEIGTIKGRGVQLMKKVNA